MKLPYRVKDFKSAQKNFDALSSMFSRITGIDFGISSIPWGAGAANSGLVGVNHKLGKAPTVVLATDAGGGTLTLPVIWTTVGYTDTNFLVTGHTDGPPAGASARNVVWLAIR